MNKIFKTAASIAATAILAITTGCGEKGFKIEGDIQGGEGEKILLEKADYSGFWTMVDSARIDEKGRFAFSQPEQGGPEIYRLALDDRYIYLPVDSTETLKVNSSKAQFGHDFTVEGTDKAVNMAKFERQLLAFSPYIDNADSLDSFKRRVYNEYLHESRGSIVAYYILTKTVDGRLLFDPATSDYKYIASVANGFDHYRPDDARTPFLKELAKAARRQHNEASGIKTVIEAEEVTMLEIALDDEKGKTRRLSDVVGKGKPVILAFTLMRDGNTPEINRQLAEIYRNGNVEIYNVSPDQDQYGWRESAANLPWITVLDPSAGQNKVFLEYNVQQLPTFYLYNSSGELTARASTVKELRSKM